LEESPAELVEINKLPLQKWLNVISKIDVKMTKAVKQSAKHLALEMEKEEKEKKRHLTGPSQSANMGTSSN